MPLASSPPASLAVPVRSHWRVGLLCLLIATPAWCDEASTNRRGGQADGLPWLSGGVGEEARQEMQRDAARYNVHVVFSDPTGHYLAAIPFSVQRGGGPELQSGVSDGPLLYLRLPAGSYRLTAEIGGVRQTRTLNVGAAGRITHINFIGPAR